jgi:hypothetical protein
MIEINATNLATQISPFSSIIGPIIGGCLASIAGLIVANYNFNRSIRERQKIAAKAFFEEISTYFDAFDLLLEDYNTTTFDEAFNDLEDPRHIKQFQILAVDQIVNLEIATWGPYATFLPEKNSFTVFYEDIYKFDDIQITRNLIELKRSLVAADKHYQNYCHDERHPPTDLYKFLETIEYAVNLISDGSMLDDLKIKSRDEVSIMKKISFSFTAIKHRLNDRFVQLSQYLKKH